MSAARSSLEVARSTVVRAFGKDFLVTASVRRTVSLALGALALPLVAFVAPPAQAAAPDSTSSSELWSPSTQRPASRAGLSPTVNPREYRAYTLDDAALAAVLAQAPLEGTRRAIGGAVDLVVPAPTGELVHFAVVESPVMEEGLAAAHPEITTYAGNATSGFPVSIRLDVTPAGFHASVRGSGPSWYVDPAYIGDDSLYLSYFGKDLPEPEQALVEPEVDRSDLPSADGDARRIGEGPNGLVKQRIFKLAFLTDDTYAEFVAPGLNDGTQDAQSNAAVLAAKVTLMNRVNQIYNDDLGAFMVLIDGTDRLNLNTSAKTTGANGPCGVTPCYTSAQIGGCSSSLLSRNRLVVGLLAGTDNFDVGHIGLGLNGGGIASLGVVGYSGKAQGCTGLPFPTGDFYAIDYVAHELGHQFAGNHTFNGTQVNCSGGNRSSSTSVEPGSGSSVMAYAGICGSDNLQPHTDPYFSQRSQTEIGTHITTTPSSGTNELQMVGLRNLDGVDSFKLSFGGVETPVIANGSNYSSAGVKAAVEAAIGGTATIAAFFNTGSFDARGFQITWSGTNGGTDVANPVLIPVAGDVAGIGGSITQGGVSTNGGSTVTTTANHNPTVTVPAAKSIPLRTPFALTGSATDSDGDALVYLWEQNDRGSANGTGLIDNTKIDGPLFRVFGTYADVTSAGTLEYNSPGENLATASPRRSFPDTDQVLAGQTNATAGTCPTPTAADYQNGSSGTLKNGPVLECYSEFLPTASYLGFLNPSALNFRLTARDVRANGGGTHFGEVQLSLVPGTGPFQVTSQASPVTYAGGSTQTVTWDVNGTNAAPLAPNVKISLSTDGGVTFDRVLLASTPNDGTQAVVIPDVATSTARIKIEAVDNYFYDINDAAVTITSTGPAPLAVVDTIPDTVATQYTDPVAASFSASSGGQDSAALVATPTGLPSGLSLAKTAASAPGSTPGTSTWAVQGNVTAPPASYPVTIDVTDGLTTEVVDFTVVVAAEDAAVTYTGPTAVTVQDPNDDVTVTADVDASADGTAGDLTRSTVTFRDTAENEVLCSATTAADGSAGCDFPAGLVLRSPGDAGRAPSRTYEVRAVVSGDYAGVTAQDTALVVTLVDGLAVTAPPTTASTQYSDPVDVAFSATSGRDDAALAASATGLPDGLSVVKTSVGTTQPATWELQGNVSGVPAVYDATVIVTDGTDSSEHPVSITVTREDASVSYTGPTSVEAPRGGDDAVDITLTADVAEAADATGGDLTTAFVTFTDATSSDTLCVSPVSGIGKASCVYSADLPARAGRGDGARRPGRTYQIEAGVGGYYSGATEQDTELVVTIVDGLAVTAPPTAATTQYSDPVEVTFSAVSGREGAVLAASATGLPAGLSVVKTSVGATQPATWALQGNVSAGPGVYDATVTVTDGTDSAEHPVSITVTREDASVSYTGPSSAEAPTGGDDAVDLTLTADVLAQADGTPGDLTLAAATFTDTTTGDELCVAPVTVAGAPGAGTASCVHSADLPPTSGRTYSIAVSIGGHFTGATTSDSPLVVTVEGTEPTEPETFIVAGPAERAIVLSKKVTFGYTSDASSGVSYVCTLDGRDRSCPVGQVTLKPTRRTHVFTVAAVVDGVADPTPASRTFTLPLNDRQLKRDGRGFSKSKKSAKAYLGSYRQATKRGATLKRNVKDAQGLALVASKGGKHGKVRIELDGKLLKKIKLKGSRSFQQVIAIRSSSKPLTGTLTITTTSKKKVRIEGLVVITDPRS